MKIIVILVVDILVVSGRSPRLLTIDFGAGPSSEWME